MEPRRAGRARTRTVTPTATASSRGQSDGFCIVCFGSAAATWFTRSNDSSDEGVSGEVVDLDCRGVCWCDESRSVKGGAVLSAFLRHQPAAGELPGTVPRDYPESAAFAGGDA